MRRNHFSLVFFIAMGLAVLFSSCQNFLQGGDIKNQIEEMIAHAKAEKYRIRFSPGSSDFGVVYPQEMNMAEGDYVTIEFDKSQGCIFNAWICCDGTGKILEDAFEFSNESVSSSKYTVDAKLIHGAEGLVVKPNCYLPSESVPPEFKTLRLAKTEEDALNGTNLISFESFVDYADKDNYDGDSVVVSANIRSHHVNCIWIYVEGDDDSSGVSELIVKEKFIRQKNGTEVSSSGEISSGIINPASSTSLKGAFKVNFKTLEDGVLNLSFALRDRAGNETSYDQTSDVVKDTELSVKAYPTDMSFKRCGENTSIYKYTVPLAENAAASYFVKDMDGNLYYKSLFQADSESHTSEKVKIRSASFGYDKKNLAPVESIGLESDSYPIVFSADTKKVGYMSVEFMDEVGNVCTSVYTIPKSVEIFNFVESTSGDSLTLYVNEPYGKFFDGDSSWYFRLSVKYTAPDGNVHELGNMSENLISSANLIDYSCITISSICYNNGSSDVTKSISSLPNGIYEISCSAVAGFGSGASFTPVFSSCDGNSIKIYKGVERPHVAEPTAEDLPTSFSVSSSAGEPNSGKIIVHVSLPEDFVPNPSLSYAVNYFMFDSPISTASVIGGGYSSNFDFEISSHKTNYGFRIEAYNSEGESARTSLSRYTLAQENVPPEADLSKLSYISPNFIRFATPAPQSGASYSTIFTDNSDGNTPGTGVLRISGKVPVKYTFLNEINMEGKIDWNSERIRVKNHPWTKALEIPFDGLLGNYLYIRVDDINGNYLEKRFDSKISRNNRDAYIFYESRLGANGLFVRVPKISTTRPFVTFEYFNPETASWAFTEKLASNGSGTDIKYFTMTAGSGDNSDICLLSLMTPTSRGLSESEKSSFIRIQPWVYDSDQDSYSLYNPVYLYPNSYISGETCNQKNFVEGKLGLEVFTDKPVLVHTFYSSVNLGDNLSDWLFGGIETGIVQKNSSFTYSSENLDEVPSGSYYTVIMHFIDGTTAMSDVRVK